MKSTDNQDMIAYAEEATAKVAEALVKSSKASGAKKSVRFNEVATLEFDSEDPSNQIDPAAKTIISIFNALESDAPVKNLENLDQTPVGKKEPFSLSTKIKDFVKSVIKFLKSPFTKQSKAELDITTEETVKQIGASDRTQSQYQDNTLKVNQHRSSEVETQVNPTRRAPPPPPEKKSAQTASQRPSTPPPTPPERKPMAHEQTGNSRTPPPPPPPPPPPMSNTFSAVAPKGHLDAIKQGVTLKSAADRKLSDAKEPQDQQPDHIGELEKRLKARREKSGQERSVTPSNKFAEDAKQFEAARKEELERQAKAEKSENEKVAKATAEEAAKKAETQPKPVALNLKPGEIPMAPPPPTPPPPPGLQTNKPFAKADPAPEQKKHQPNQGPQPFGVNEKDIQDVRSALKSANLKRKREDTPEQTDFRNVLSKKNNKSPER